MQVQKLSFNIFIYILILLLILISFFPYSGYDFYIIEEYSPQNIDGTCIVLSTV